MLILEARPQGSTYPQLTQAPIDTYANFLNFFRGGHTIDDNVMGRVVADTLQGAALKISLTSGYLTKTKNMAMPNDSVADIFLTPSGSELIQAAVDRKFCELAVELARKSIPEDKEPHPFVGVVVVRDGEMLATGFRGETGKGGDHGEFCALKKLTDDVDKVDLTGCTVYTTLEPCSTRKPNKTPCANRLINARATRVVYGLGDKDETVYGHIQLQEAHIPVGVFPQDLIDELQEMNERWSGTRRQLEVAPPSNGGTSTLANASYYKTGTSMTDNTHFFVRLPKDDGGFFTVEDINKNVLAWGRTVQEIAMKWHQIDNQKVIIEGMQRVSSGSSHPLLTLR
jgi:pyrimidine deaminase RibD-like protein